MKYIHENQEFDFTVEQDGAVGSLVIQVITIAPTETTQGERLHISDPITDANGNYSSGNILARVTLPPLEY